MEKRIRPTWDELFMFSAYLIAARSSCMHLQTGCVIVKDKRILASGYNGAPPGIKNCLEQGCRKDRENIDFFTKGTSACRGIHAEINTLSQIHRQGLKGATLYTLTFPCNDCAKAIIANGILEVVYIKHYKEPDSLVISLFEEAGVKLIKLSLDMNKIIEMIKEIEKNN